MVVTPILVFYVSFLSFSTALDMLTIEHFFPCSMIFWLCLPVYGTEICLISFSFVFHLIGLPDLVDHLIKPLSHSTSLIRLIGWFTYAHERSEIEKKVQLLI